MIRGEAVMLQSQQACSTKVTMRQSISATSEPFLVTGIADSELATEEGVFVFLQESAIFTQSSFCRQQRGLSPSYFVPISVEATQCAFLLSDTYLIETIGATSFSKMQGNFFWNGSNNIVQEAKGAWHLQPIQNDLVGPTMDFQEWKEYWSVEPSVEKRVWAGLTDPSQPVHTLVPADFLFPLSTPAGDNPRREHPLNSVGPTIQDLPKN
jgi:hypothetical protein